MAGIVKSLLMHAYYQAKPYIPWNFRMTMKRIRANRILNQFKNTWPINEATRACPSGWPGWPEGKQFAFVLTHDVEGRKGLDRCLRLMEAERGLGFRSSFNFVPEGEYFTPKALRHTLTENGFEVGVHDLKHDGKLYRSRSQFQRAARQINRFLEDWGAVGFRSGFMHHNLEWIHDLNIKYDASAFDYDPFEPQSDGANTIFPFWVSSPNTPGYVELPYTMVQDSTIFLSLQERTIAIWKKKLDWVASHGGMVLLNTHPDYMNFDGNDFRSAEYPFEMYCELMCYVREMYSGQYWHALPRDIAEYAAGIKPAQPSSRPKRVCMLAYSHYDWDNRIMRYAETLAARGDTVDAIGLYGENGISKPAREEMVRGVNVIRIQHRKYNETSKWSYINRIFRFMATAAWTLWQRHRREPYDLIHVHNLPDFLVFAAWYPRLRGARIILDIHDVLPEMYGSKFGTGKGGLVFRMLLLAEKASMNFADHVIVANHIWYDRLIQRATTSDKCSVFLNHIDERIFYRRERRRCDGKIRLLFPGSLNWHQGVDIAIRSVALLRERLPTLEMYIYGCGDQKPALRELVHELHLEDRVFFPELVPLTEIPQIIADSDIGVVPKRANSFGNEAYSTKIMEFMSQNIPVVVTRTKIDSYYFDESVVEFSEPQNEAALADAIHRIATDKVRRESLSQNGLAYAERNCWRHKKAEYLDLVDRLVCG